MCHVITITGAVGSGKSTLTRLLAAEGACCIDADRVAHEVLQRPEVCRQLQERFPEECFSPNQQVIPQQLACQAFASKENLQGLTDVVYPLIRESLRQQIQALKDQQPPLIVLEAPTLFEARCEVLVDFIVTVEADTALRSARCQKGRDWDLEELNRRDRFLCTPEERKARANQLIINNGEESELIAAARTLFQNHRVSKKPS